MSAAKDIDQVRQALWMRVDDSINGCWPWTGARSESTGYGANFWGKSPHRWSYIAAKGPIPDGHVIDHICHNDAAGAGTCDGGDSCPHRLCCNPDHLRAVTHGENLRSSPLTSNGRGRTPCAYDGCEMNVNRATGYCSKHHRRYYKYGDPAIVSPRLTRPSVCMVEGCDERHHANGYCAVHAARVRTHGDPHVVKQLQTSDRPDVCVVEGCGRPHRARGWCGSHWYRWKKHGDVMADVPIGQPGVTT